MKIILTPEINFQILLEIQVPQWKIKKQVFNPSFFVLIL